MITNVQHKDRKFDHAIINLQDITDVDCIEYILRYAEDNEKFLNILEKNEQLQYVVQQLWQMINSTK
jgi:hypothetical protein